MSVAMDTLENAFESAAWPSQERSWRAQALALLQDSKPVRLLLDGIGAA